MPATGKEPLLRVRGLSKEFRQRRRIAGGEYVVRALDAVDLELASGSTLALVGESGSGKSTLARCLVRLEEPTTGEMWFAGRNLLELKASELARVRRKMQLIFQDPAAALNPRLSAAEIVAEPLLIQRLGTKREQRAQALVWMEKVGLRREWAVRSPLEFSGGQRQRLAIARALILQPRLLILDEALSALDLSVQAQIVNLLLEQQAELDLAYLYISHDLSLAGVLADEVAVMHRGRIVERASCAQLFAQPQHAHTRALLAAVPATRSGRETGGVLPSPQ